VSSTPFTNSIPLPDPVPPVALDLNTVATVLYVSPFDRRDWARLGPANLARYVKGVAADPRFRVPELVVLVDTAERSGQLAHADHLTAARRYARRVLAVLSN
jgi:hypothetical protein